MIIIHLKKNLLRVTKKYNIMKNVILTIIAFTALSVEAQSPVYSLLDNGYGYQQTPGVYYKDTYNDFNKFVGEWKYQQGNKSFTIVLQKRTMYYDTEEGIYEDLLVGEYRYVDENGIEQVNTLSNIDNTNPYNNNIWGGNIIPFDPNNRTVRVYFKDPERSYLWRYINLKHFPEQILGQHTVPEHITVSFMGEPSIEPYENAPMQLRVPEEVDYILIKQP